MAILNRARVDGLVGTADIFMETQMSVETFSMTFTKTANQEIWAGGQLTYTINIENSETTAYTNVVITDTLEVANVDFVNESVTVLINGVETTPDYTYNETTGVLTVTLGTIPAFDEVEGTPGTAVITFRVTKK